MPRVGLEPTFPCGSTALNRMRLPISPPWLVLLLIPARLPAGRQVCQFPARNASRSEAGGRHEGLFTLRKFSKPCPLIYTIRGSLRIFPMEPSRSPSRSSLSSFLESHK